MKTRICSIHEKFPQCYSVLRFCFDFGRSVIEKPEAWSENRKRGRKTGRVIGKQEECLEKAYDRLERPAYIRN